MAEFESTLTFPVRYSLISLANTCLSFESKAPLISITHIVLDATGVDEPPCPIIQSQTGRYLKSVLSKASLANVADAIA